MPFKMSRKMILGVHIGELQVFHLGQAVSR